jgi:hypothetical protein
MCISVQQSGLATLVEPLHLHGEELLAAGSAEAYTVERFGNG